VLEAAGPDVPVKTPVIVFMFPIILSAYVGGLAPGLLATALSTLAAFYFILPPPNTWHVENPLDNIKWITLLAAGTLISFLMAHRAPPRLKETAQQPESLLLSAERRVRVGFAALLTCLIAVAAVSYPAVVRFRNDAAWVDHTHRVIATLRLLLASATDAETNERGYIITDKDEFLGQYKSALQNVEGDIKELSRLAIDSPEQQRRLDALEPLVAERLLVLQEGIERRRQSFAPGKAIVLSGRSEHFHDQIRSVVAEMEAAEKALLVQREARENRASTMVKILVLGASALAILIVAGALWVIARAFGASRRSEMALQESRDQLEIRVNERTMELKNERDRAASDLAALKRMHALSEKVLEAGELQPLLQETTDAAVEIMGAQRGTLQLVEGDSLRIEAQHGHQQPFLDFFASAENRASACGAAMARGERVMVPDVEESPLFAGTPSLQILRRAGVQAVQSTPLVSRTGALLGILTTQWDEPHSPDRHDLWRLDLLARQAADLIEHARSEEQLRTTLESIGDGFLACDAGWRLIYINAAGEHLLGLRREDVVGKLGWEVFPHLLSTESEQGIRAAAAGEIREFEHFSQPRSCWFDVRCFPRRGGGTSIYFKDTTERKRSEEALRENEARLANEKTISDNLINSLPGIFYLFDENGRFLRWNQNNERVTGYSSKEFAGMNMIDLIDGDEREFVRRRMKEVFENGVGEVEANVVSKDGTKTPYWMLGVRIFLQNKMCLLGYAYDLSERKRAEEALEAHRGLLETVVNYVPAALNLIRGSDLRLQLVNPAYQAIAPGKEMVGRTLDELWPETGRDFAALCRRVLETGEPYQVDDEINMIRRRPEGPLERAYFTWSLRRVLLPGDEGWGLLNTAWETTARKQAEEALRTSETFLRAITDSSPEPIFVKDVDGRMLLANLAALAAIGKPKEAVLGKTDEEFLDDPAIGRAIMANDRRVMESGRTEVIEELVSGSDGLHTFLSTKTPYRNAEGEVFGVIGNARDITELKRMQEALAKRAEELARSNADLEQFAYVASHDLKEPLRAVSGSVGLLQRHYEGKLDDLGHVCIGNAVEGVLRMESLIDSLLAYSRVATRGVEFGPVESADVLGRALHNLAAGIQESGGEISHDTLPQVHGDASQLVSLFQNLIGNALKFRQVRAPRVHVSAERSNKYWRFAVRDNGIGIDPEHFEKIFRVFHRLHARSRYPGTGIGLALCKKIVERHGGRIWIESAPGAGSTFYFTLRDAQTNKEARDSHAERPDAA
jgi:PAS domain S-box-containing protein